MAVQQIVLYALIIFVAGFYIRRILLFRSVRHYSPDEAAERVSDGRAAVLLDVRTAGERSEHLIRGSLHIPLQELRSRSEELEKYRNSEIICYCRSGNRSLSAAAALRKQGFNAANLKGGIVEWNYSGQK